MVGRRASRGKRFLRSRASRRRVYASRPRSARTVATMTDLLPRRPDANRSPRDQATRSKRVAVPDARWNSEPCLRLESRRKNLQSSAASRGRNRNSRHIELAGGTRSLRVPVVLVPSRGAAGIAGPRPIFVCFAELDLHDAGVDRRSSSVSFSGYGLRCQRCRGSWLAVVPAGNIGCRWASHFLPSSVNAGTRRGAFQSMPAKEYRQ